MAFDVQRDEVLLRVLAALATKFLVVNLQIRPGPAALRLVPEIVSSGLVADGSGVRAQAVRPDGSLVDDFHFVQTEGMLHVWNIPSPAATASLPFGRYIAEIARKGLQAAKRKERPRLSSAVAGVIPGCAACANRNRKFSFRSRRTIQENKKFR